MRRSNEIPRIAAASQKQPQRMTSGELLKTVRARNAVTACRRPCQKMSAFHAVVLVAVFCVERTGGECHSLIRVVYSAFVEQRVAQAQRAALTGVLGFVQGWFPVEPLARFVFQPFAFLHLHLQSHHSLDGGSVKGILLGVPSQQRFSPQAVSRLQTHARRP